jgi:hypothetical protein
MAQEPKLKVDGTDLPNLLEVSYELAAGVDKDGRPTRMLQFDGIRVRRIGDARTALANWARDPKEKNRKGGEIQFFADTGKPMKKLTWKNGFVKHYNLRYNPQSDHVEEIVWIQAEEITCGGLKLNFEWADKG